MTDLCSPDGDSTIGESVIVRRGALLVSTMAMVMAAAVFIFTIDPSGAVVRSQAISRSATGATYVAMGDSYSSGEGLPGARSDQWLNNSGVPWSSKDGCDRSALSYPALVAAAEGDSSNYKFVACSGATTGSTADQSSFTMGGTLINGADGEPSQLDALSPTNTTEVSLTIGGDDLGFTKVLEACVGVMAKYGPLSYVASSRAPGASPAKCKSTLAQATSVATAAASSGPSLEGALIDTYSKILTGAPKASLYVLNYPQLLTTAKVTKFCPLTGALHISGVSLYLGLDPSQVTQIDELEADLNSDIEGAAQQVSQTFGADRIVVVDVNGLTANDGQPCSTAGMSRSVVNGVLFSGGDTLSTVYGDCFHGNLSLVERCFSSVHAGLTNLIAKDSLHPTADGQSLMAKALISAITAHGSSGAPSSQWSLPQQIDTGNPLNSVSCIAANYCKAVDAVGNVLSYNGISWTSPQSIDPGNQLTSVSCISSTFCMAVDAVGNALSYNGASWTAPQSIDPGNQLTSVSCISSTFCMAVDASGNVIAFNGSGWTASAANGNLLGAVSCSSSSFCVTVGYANTGGNAFVFNGSSWSAGDEIDPGYKLHSVSCFSSSFCVAGASVNVFSFDGSSWTPPDSIDLNDGNGIGLPSVSCPSTSFCATVDAIGNVLTFNGSAWSAPEDIDGDTAMNGVSCPTEYFCVATDEDGNVVTMR